MILSVGILIAGFVVLLKGADWLVEGSCVIARRAGISQLVIGLTFVSFGTSLPEFFINIASRMGGSSGITVGNILGSNIANILLILGLAAMARPLVFGQSTMVWEIPFAMGSALLLAFLLAWQSALAGTDPTAFHGLTQMGGLALLIFFAFFLYYIFRLQKSPAGYSVNSVCSACPLNRAVLMVLVGIPALAFGSNWVVREAAHIAAALGMRPSVIGLTIVAVGTTLPELATSLTASIKKRSDLAVGNVIGSNVFNICWILGLSSVISPLEISNAHGFDIGIILAATALLLVSVYVGRRGVVGRWNGGCFVVLYIAYLAWTVYHASVMGG